MPKFLIERQIPGVERWGPDQLKAVARKSNEVLEGLGTQIQWIQSYVAPGRLYCVYISPDEALIREHAKLGGFPCNNVTRIDRVIDPTTAES